ncbi:MAG: FIST C-terminal domain-containing protein [Defluviitaleaceae bacterium]|nr:FIST C-terminal domain-containing protein [Defluviitaleaceae bacterium]
MLTMYTARTAEVDVFEDAMAEIKEQIDFSLLGAHSGGIIFCCMDFFESGMVKALCDALPFDVICMTSMANACKNGHGFYDLSLTVLTGDDVRFTAGMVKDINIGNYEEKIQSLYNGLNEKAGGEPTFIISFLSYLHDVAGYKMVAAADKAANGVPIWGSLASCINVAVDTVGVACNGEFSSSGAAMLFMNGPLTPRYVLASLPEYNITNTRGIITKSDGAMLIEINDIPVMEYFNTMGIELSEENVRATPLMVYHQGSTAPVALAFYAVQENGSILMGGEVPVGASVAVGGIDSNTIIDSCRNGLDELLAYQDGTVTIILPCVTRGVMLVPEQDGEAKLIRNTLNERGVPFVMGYAGGEISPMIDNEGKSRNRFHNYTFCAVVLK